MGLIALFALFLIWVLGVVVTLNIVDAIRLVIENVRLGQPRAGAVMSGVTLVLAGLLLCAMLLFAWIWSAIF